MDKLPDVFNLKEWVEENKEKLKPPTAAITVLRNEKYMVTIVGGPNSRTDYHVNQGTEFFYQLTGTMILTVQENQQVRDIPISEGEIYLLPPMTPHAPQRPENTVGLVVESIRQPEELDTHQWYCQKCNHLLFEKSAYLEVMERDMPPIFDAYYSNTENQTCGKCGYRNPGRPDD
jgi:3-hydroxyanthranilate 3,4-dioxygenase